MKKDRADQASMQGAKFKMEKSFLHDAVPVQNTSVKKVGWALPTRTKKEMLKWLPKGASL
jgi:hypothetical protein